MATSVLEEQVIKLNKQAIEEIKQQNFDKSLGLLKQALLKIQKFQQEPQKSRLMTQTFNSLGSFFKKTENLEEAIKYFIKATDLEMNLPEAEKGYVALAHLNLCNCFSQRLDHDKAIRHGLFSISLMKRLYRIVPKLGNSLVIAHFNVGNEYRSIKDITKAENIFKQGLNSCREILGTQHELYRILYNTLTSISMAKGRETLRKTQKTPFKPSITPISRLPVVHKKRSGSDDRDYYKNYYRNYWNSAQPEESSFTSTIYEPKPPKKAQRYIISDEDTSAKTDKSKSSSNWTRRIDINRHKETEKTAAVIIQSWWRGLKARRVYEKKRLEYNLKIAEMKAKSAMAEYEQMKLYASRVASNRRVRQKIYK